MATPGIVGERHYNLAQEIRRTLAQYEDLKDIIAMLGMEQLSAEDRKVVARARRLERFLTQPFFATEQFSGLKGKMFSLQDSLDGYERILRDEFKDYPESALYLIGAIGEAKKPDEAPKPKPERRMRLRLLLPNQIFADKTDVLGIVADSSEGSSGLLPQRLDCVTALVPGILTYVTKQDGTVYVAVDDGVLVKTGADVRVSVRHAVGGKDLAGLHDAVNR